MEEYVHIMYIPRAVQFSGSGGNAFAVFNCGEKMAVASMYITPPPETQSSMEDWTLHADKIPTIRQVWLAKSPASTGMATGNMETTANRTAVHVHDTHWGSEVFHIIRNTLESEFNYASGSNSIATGTAMGISKTTFTLCDATLPGWRNRIKSWIAREKREAKEIRSEHTRESLKRAEKITEGVYFDDRGPILGNGKRPKWLREMWEQAMEEAEKEVPKAKVGQEEADDLFYKYWKKYWEKKRGQKEGQ